MSDQDDDALLDALGVELTPLKSTSHTPREERIMAGFEDILRFFETHQRAPRHGPDADIFERLYAVRLEQIRNLPEAQTLLAHMDSAQLLNDPTIHAAAELDEDALLAELGVSESVAQENDITVLRHVRSSAEKKAAEDIASRTPCVNFQDFKPFFEEALAGLKTGAWLEKPYLKNAGIEVGDFFIVGGQVAYVAEEIESGQTSDGRANPRLRVVFNNGTEANLLLRSLARSLYPDGDLPTGRRLMRRDNGPLFGESSTPSDVETGTIYVLRSQSNHLFVAQHRDLVHKIGVTGGRVETRIAGAEKEPTFLLAAVDVVATYKLHNINRSKLEHLFHRLFAEVQLDLTIEDRFGQSVKPREWFLLPLSAIEQAVQAIRDGTIQNKRYDPQQAQFVDV